MNQVPYQYANPPPNPTAHSPGDVNSMSYMNTYASMPYPPQATAYAVVDTATGQITSIIPANSAQMAYHHSPPSQVWHLPYGPTGPVVPMSEILPTPPKSPMQLPPNGNTSSSTFHPTLSPMESLKKIGSSSNVSQQILSIHAATKGNSSPRPAPLALEMESKSVSSPEPQHQILSTASPPNSVSRVVSTSRPSTPARSTAPEGKIQGTSEEHRLPEVVTMRPTSAPNVRNSSGDSQERDIGDREPTRTVPSAKRARSRAISEESEVVEDILLDDDDASEGGDSDDDDDYVGKGGSASRQRSRNSQPPTTRRRLTRIEDHEIEHKWINGKVDFDSAEDSNATDMAMADTNTSITEQYELTATGKVRKEKKKYVCAVEGCGKIYRNLGGLKYHK
ncbi:hypothetical protein HDU93_003437, partial [Gonapodya sp. JEL0774]